MNRLLAVLADAVISVALFVGGLHLADLLDVPAWTTPLFFVPVCAYLHFRWHPKGKGPLFFIAASVLFYGHLWIWPAGSHSTSAETKKQLLLLLIPLVCLLAWKERRAPKKNAS